LVIFRIRHLEGRGRAVAAPACLSNHFPLNV
jgi:hypothetical protein